MLEQTGYVGIEIGPAVDTFAGARGEENARAFDVQGYPFLARRPEATSAAEVTAPSSSRGPTAGT